MSSSGFHGDQENNQREDISGYISIKESIDKITKGLQSKDSINMKQIIGEIYKIRHVVGEKIDENSAY